MSDPNPLEHVVGTGRPARGQSLERTLEQRNAAWADADRLADHLRNAIHDLIEDWGDDGPLMRYDDARAALRQHEKASEPDASPAGAGGTATRSEGLGPTSTPDGSKPGGDHIVIGLVSPFDTDDGERP